MQDVASASKSSRKGRSSKQAKADGDEKSFDVLLAQDKTALRSRKGDTGSVLWRARCAGFLPRITLTLFIHSTDFDTLYLSLELAQLLLLQRSSRTDALLDPVRLAEAHVLELGYAMTQCTAII